MQCAVHKYVMLYTHHTHTHTHTHRKVILNLMHFGATVITEVNTVIYSVVCKVQLICPTGKEKCQTHPEEKDQNRGAIRGLALGANGTGYYRSE